MGQLYRPHEENELADRDAHGQGRNYGWKLFCKRTDMAWRIMPYLR